MTDEEKKAIKKIDIIVKECELKFKTLGYECDLYDEDEPIPVNEYRTLLNLIEKQQQEIENSVPKEAIREKLDKLNIKIEQYNDYRKLEKETDVEYYENIINTEMKKVLEEILGE